VTEAQKGPGALERWQRLKDEGRPISEHILNILKAGLSAAPFTGAIASLLTDYIPSSRARRLEEFAEHIAEDLRSFEGRVNTEYIRSDDFAFMFEKCFRGVAENPQREKVQAFRGVLVNSVLRSDRSEEEKEYFLNLVNTLSALHIRILRFMHDPEGYLRAAGIPPASIQGGFDQFFPVAIPGVRLDVIRSAFADLFRYGFINTDQSIFTTMTSAQGLHLLRGRVSDLGRRFMQFCIVPP
jgi:hypothetical protein